MGVSESALTSFGTASWGYTIKASSVRVRVQFFYGLSKAPVKLRSRDQCNNAYVSSIASRVIGLPLTQEILPCLCL